MQATEVVFAALVAIGSSKADMSHCFLDVAVMLLQVRIRSASSPAWVAEA